MVDLTRRVSAHLELDTRQSLAMILKLAVSDMPGAGLAETLTVTADGAPLSPTETLIPGEGRTHLLTVEPGRVLIDYTATVTGRAAEAPVTEADRVIYLRPSRYAESDRLTAVARSEFAGITTPAELLAAVSSWVGTRLSYVPGSSGPTDGAIDTLISDPGTMVP